MGVSKKPKQSSPALVRQPIVDPELWMRINAAVQQIQLDAESFRNGTLLQDLAHQHHRNFNQFLSAHQGNLEGVVTWGSQCSGSEGTDFVISAAQQAFEESGKGVVFQQKFACEITEDKRKWIDLVINTKRRQKGEDPICIFCDIQHMGEATAKCWVHKTDCRVPDVNILVVSTSCKDLSRMSRQGKKDTKKTKNQCSQQPLLQVARQIPIVVVCWLTLTIITSTFCSMRTAKFLGMKKKGVAVKSQSNMKSRMESRSQICSRITRCSNKIWYPGVFKARPSCSMPSCLAYRRTGTG